MVFHLACVTSLFVVERDRNHCETAARYISGIESAAKGTSLTFVVILAVGITN
jgi:hypothetical protein